MISINNVSLQFAYQKMFEEINLNIYSGQKVGLVGTNGSGKTTLLKLISQEMEPDQGQIEIPKDWNIVHMSQTIEDVDSTAIDFVMTGDHRLNILNKQLIEAEKQQDEKSIIRVTENIDKINGFDAKHRAEKLLSGLGFTPCQFKNQMQSFSGGWQMRLNLAKALFSSSHLLLLDEPTNHLDLEALFWLENWLRNYDGTFIIISHDRDFLDRTTESTVYLTNQKALLYQGNYSKFEKLHSEFLSQNAAIREKIAKKTEETEKFINRFRAKSSKAKQVQSRIKALDKLSLSLALPLQSEASITFKLLDIHVPRTPLLTITKGSIGYLKNSLVDNIEMEITSGMRIGILGKNGIGKSTLIKTMAKQQPLINGELSINDQTSIGYFTQHHGDALDPTLNPIEQFIKLFKHSNELELRNYLGSFGFVGNKSIEPIRFFSGGEKTRLALALLLWTKPNLLLLDEPTNHLDLLTRQALILALQAYQGAIILISHDRYLLRHTMNEFWIIKDKKYNQFNGSLEDYEIFIKQTDESLKKTATISKHDSNPNKKEQRKVDAELRKQLAPLKQKIKKTEKDINSLEMKLDEIEKQLANDSMYTPENKDTLKNLLIEQSKMKTQLLDLEEQWLAENDDVDRMKESIS